MYIYTSSFDVTSSLVAVLRYCFLNVTFWNIHKYLIFRKCVYFSECAKVPPPIFLSRWEKFFWLSGKSLLSQPFFICIPFCLWFSLLGWCGCSWVFAAPWKMQTLEDWVPHRRPGCSQLDDFSRQFPLISWLYLTRWSWGFPSILLLESQDV